MKRGSRIEDVEKLKRERLEVIKKLNVWKSNGYRPVYIDETHWQMGLVSKRARSKTGTTPVVHMGSGVKNITVIASMSDLGF